jgi:hypothetical protein
MPITARKIKYLAYDPKGRTLPLTEDEKEFTVIKNLLFLFPKYKTFQALKNAGFSIKPIEIK